MFTISPLLGIDVQTKGVTAILVSAVVVFGFMLIYYLVAGVVADLCLVLNLVLVVGAMAFIDATFTLPGLAGLVLTIGMAVDSNVLIYERIGKNWHAGELRMAIENGFDKPCQRSSTGTSRLYSPRSFSTSSAATRSRLRRVAVHRFDDEPLLDPVLRPSLLQDYGAEAAV
jgi:preprotein translocase subunit SecF